MHPEWLTPPKMRLIEAAEELFGEFGIQGVSLREISKAAGNHNVSAALYHFGSKDELIVAIVQARRPHVDSRRMEIIAQRGLAVNRATSVEIVDILHQGLYEQTNRKGKRSFASFLSALLAYDLFPSFFWDYGAETAPFTKVLYDELRSRMTHLSDSEWEFRIFELGRMAAFAIAGLEQTSDALKMCETMLLDNLANVVVSGLEAPAAKMSADMVETTGRLVKDY